MSELNPHIWNISSKAGAHVTYEALIFTIKAAAYIDWASFSLMTDESVLLSGQCDQMRHQSVWYEWFGQCVSHAGAHRASWMLSLLDF